MKKVWILEKYVTVEEMERTLSDLEQGYEANRDKFTEEQIATMESTLEAYKKKIKENPNGYWLGFEGKSIYKQFCNVARAALERAEKGARFRVVEGEVKDDAKFWTGYKFVKENEGVFRYLMATCNK